LFTKAFANAVSAALPRGTHDQIDVRNFIAFANEGFADAEFGDFRHRHLLPRKFQTDCLQEALAHCTTAILVDSVRIGRTG
jgi:hypothetical protein